jgi:hypothetical protein
MQEMEIEAEASRQVIALPKLSISVFVCVSEDASRDRVCWDGSITVYRAVLYTKVQLKSINNPEVESKEKHDAWEAMQELTVTSPYVHSRVDSNTFTMGNPMPESTLTLFQSRLYPPVRDFGFGLRHRFTKTICPLSLLDSLYEFPQHVCKQLG